MPVMDGITLLKHIKALGRYTPSVVFITGFSDFRRREAYDMGVEAMMQKPFEPGTSLLIPAGGILGSHQHQPLGRFRPRPRRPPARVQNSNYRAICRNHTDSNRSDDGEAKN
jgi:DNA-binding response OmpR family regulator